MKKTALLIAALIFCFHSLYAQNKSSLRIRLSDGTPLQVALNNRYFQKTGTSLIIGDIPGRRLHIRVYRFRAYADGRGGKAELVFSGTLKIQKGSNYDAVVDVRNRKLRMIEVNTFEFIPEQQALPPNRDQVIESNPSVSLSPPNETTGELSPELQTIQTAMNHVSTDKEKLTIAQRYVGDQISVADAAQIAEWFFFDDTKIEFLKSIYGKLTDKVNNQILTESLSTSESKKELTRWMQTQ